MKMQKEIRYQLKMSQENQVKLKENQIKLEENKQKIEAFCKQLRLDCLHGISQARILD